VGTGERVVRVSGRTDASAEDVWACLADPYSYARWVSGTAEVRDADPRWPAVGARLRHRFGPWPVRFPDHSTVLECDPPRRLVLAASARPFGVVRAELTVIPDHPGAWITLSERMIGGLGARWPRLGDLVQRPRNRRSLQLLVSLAEQRHR
jgi:uncharacterized protein YndB with AHSA1/START domain